MWSKKITIETNASKERIWELWSDVENWRQWDGDVKQSKLNGKFETGTRGIIKPTNGPKSNFVIQSATFPTEFTIRLSLPLGKMDFTHQLTENNGKLFLTHGLEIRGITTFLFSRIFGKKIMAELPKGMYRLSAMAKQV
jgi:uncharacterized protein YndB with AHSA1/START domain